MTEQNHLEEVEIHRVFRKYKAQGVNLFNTHVIHQGGIDFTDYPDFQEAQNMITRASEIFGAVPAEIRDDFQNDPGRFIAFMSNPENIEAIAEYGFDYSYLGDLPETPAPRVEPDAPGDAPGEAPPTPDPTPTGVE